MASISHNFLTFTPMEPAFEERQYLGYNRYSLIRRMVMAIFCFMTYFITSNSPGYSLSNTGDVEALLFYMGIATLVISGLLVMVLHIHTEVTDHSIVLDGLWTSRKVKIDLSVIEKVERVEYSSYLLNRPVYNLHRKGLIKFYTRGKYAVELTDRDGLRYLIGSQKSHELLEALQSRIGAKTA